MTNNFTTEKIVVPIDRVIPNAWNPNSMSKQVFDKQKNSLVELGLMGSILVRRINHTNADYEILDGEHRFKASKELQYTEIPVEVITKDVSDKEAKLLTILLNNLHGEDDIFKRAEILKSLDSGQLQLLPFTAEEIENEKKFVDFDFGQYEGEKDIPERQFAQVIVLQMNVDEAVVWNKAKQSLQEREKISKDQTKKKADIQLVMFLIRNYLSIVDNHSFDDTNTVMKI